MRKEPDAVREVHEWREALAGEWEDMKEKEILASINEAGNRLREKIRKKKKEVA